MPLRGPPGVGLVTDERRDLGPILRRAVVTLNRVFPDQCRAARAPPFSRPLEEQHHPRLTIDGYAPRSTSGTRWFVTPPLEPGRAFHYELRAEVERGGKRLTQTREVAVRAGQQSEVTIQFPGT